MIIHEYQDNATIVINDDITINFSWEDSPWVGQSHKEWAEFAYYCEFNEYNLSEEDKEEVIEFLIKIADWDGDLLCTRNTNVFFGESMEFRNVDKFERWLRENKNFPYYDLNAFLEDLDKRHGESGNGEGSADFELDGVTLQTKSKHPECIGYECEYVYESSDNKEDEEREIEKTIYTF